MYVIVGSPLGWWACSVCSRGQEWTEFTKSILEGMYYTWHLQVYSSVPCAFSMYVAYGKRVGASLCSNPICLKEFHSISGYAL